MTDSGFRTDQCLRSYLNSNQSARERMCLAILGNDRRFSNVMGRQPNGGPDGGWDLEAVFEQNLKVRGAVGFVNNANDSSTQLSQIDRKFAGDLKSARRADDNINVFVFMTNVSVPATRQDKMKSQGVRYGFTYCEIFDRERLRAELDSVDGYAIRFRFLNIELSQAEQASFFARWGQDIQRLIQDKFEMIEDKLARLTFLHESQKALDRIVINITLDNDYRCQDVPIIRAFCKVIITRPMSPVSGVLFGTFDGRSYPEQRLKYSDTWPAERESIHSIQWDVSYQDDDSSSNDIREKNELSSEFATSLSPIIRMVSLSYKPSSSSVSLSTMNDIEHSGLILIINSSLAQKIQKIRFLVNGYKFIEVDKDDIYIDQSSFTPDFPLGPVTSEQVDRWVRVRPRGASFFSVDFSKTTPQRLSDPALLRPT